ncbi:MAG: hypothetical protein M9894_06070 [Planctomycetes bacterium]|nr:hypothetical protein [Planctomycetota bacterium]
MTRSRAAPLLAALVAVAVAWPAVRNGWVDYDEALYARSSFLLLLSLAPSNLARLLTSAGPGYQHQPVTYLSHAVDHALWGEDPHVFHAVDVALYALLTALVAVLARAVARDLPALRERAGLVAFAAGVAFAVHPVHVESYAWIGDRKDVLAGLFALGALLVERRARRAAGRRWPLRLVALGLFAASLGAKVAALGLGLLVALDALLDPPRAAPPRARLRRAAAAGLPYLVLGLVGSLLWLALQRGYPVPLGAPAGDVSLLERLLFPLRCLGHYVRVLVWPAGLCVHYFPHPTPAAWAKDLVPLAVAAGAGLVVAWRGGGAARALVGVAAAWLVIGLGPVLNVVRLGFVNDRYLLFPSVGVAVAAGGLLALGARGPRGPTVLAAGLAACALLVIVSARRIPDWASADALWGAQVRVDPDNPNGHIGLAVTRLRAGDAAGAEAHLAAARALWPEHPGLGQLGSDDERLDDAERAARALARGDLDAAEGAARDALRRHAKHGAAHVVVGKVLLARGDPAAALPHLAFAAHHVADVDATYHAAVAAWQAGRLDEAGLHVEVLERAGPTWRSRLLAADLARARGRPDQALACLRQARALLQDDAGDEAWPAVGVALAAAGALHDALEVLGRHHARGAAAPGAVYDLARVEALAGRRPAAARHLAEALARDPALAARAAQDPALRGLLP